MQMQMQNMQQHQQLDQGGMLMQVDEAPGPDAVDPNNVDPLVGAARESRAFSKNAGDEEVDDNSLL